MVQSDRRKAAGSNITTNARESDKDTAVEVTRHSPLVFLVKLMLKARKRAEKLRKGSERKGAVGNLPQGKLRNSTFGEQHYN
jgi:hypothetical protein